jgi:hypothetical protein
VSAAKFEGSGTGTQGEELAKGVIKIAGLKK